MLKSFQKWENKQKCLHVSQQLRVNVALDLERDIRGFALKFYTEDGNWDLVGNNTPVFFFRDPKLFVSLNRAVKEIHEQI